MSGGPYCYAYDGDGVRVAKAHASGGSCTGTVTVDVLYWRNIAGQTIAETDSAGSTSNASYHEYVFFAGRRVARSDPSSGSVYYFFVDQVGSTRIVTQANGSVCFEQDYFPYGQEINTGTQSCPQSYKFTGYERDAETGLDYAFARYYNQRLARFMSVDPLAGDVGDPQSLNRYAYVRNNSTNFIDPTGMFISTIPFVVYTGGGGRSPFEPTDPKDCEGGCPPTWPDQKKPKPRQPSQSQTFNECMAENGNKFSIAGVVGGSAGGSSRGAHRLHQQQCITARCGELHNEHWVGKRGRRSSVSGYRGDSRCEFGNGFRTHPWTKNRRHHRYEHKG